jgi:MFS family permease
MRLPGTFVPRDRLTRVEVRDGLRMLLFDGVCTQAMVVLTGGAFLVAFALLLGASNKVIGLVAAAGPIAQVLQIPSIFLVERVGLRKLLVVLGAALGRLFWILVALVPWLVAPEHRLVVFLAAIFAYSGLGAIGGCAFTPWMRDFVPRRIMGAYFAKRLAAAVAVGAALSIVAGVAVDAYRAHHPDPMGAYTGLFLLGAAIGLVGSVFLSRIPEPRMAPPERRRIGAVLAEPLRDVNFRNLLVFLGTWNFAVNLAAPFFAVYMLRRLGLSMTWIMALFLVGQLTNVLFLRVWGSLADRFTNKAVLAATGPLFIVSIALWPLTNLPSVYMLTLPILFLIHILAGMSTAGVALSTWNIALKAAPSGSATSYLATNALVSGLAATAAPMIAGAALDWAGVHEVVLALGRPATVRAAGFPSLSLHGLDFLFIAAVAFGAYALRRLAVIREAGRVQESIRLTEVSAEVRRTLRSVSNIAGLRLLTSFPYGFLRARSETEDDDEDGDDGADTDPEGLEQPGPGEAT